MITIETPDYDEVTPVTESRALRQKLSGLVAHSSNNPQGLVVPVHFVNPDFELSNADYPGIYIAYGNVTRASDREHRGPTNLEYAPAGYPTNVLVPADIDDKDSVALVDWSTDGFGRLNSPYYVPEFPIPYNLDYNISVLTRNYQQAMELIVQLQDIERIPPRFGGLEVPEDGTVRTLDLMGGPETGPIVDADGKRVVQTLYSVRVTAELNLYQVQEIIRVATINVTTTAIQYF